MWILRRNSMKTLFFLIFTIILCSHPLYTTAQIRTFSYQEKITYGPSVITRIWDSRRYDDGTILLRVIRKNTTSSLTPTTPCFNEVLSLRFIYPNGTVAEKDIHLNIQSFNYCAFQGPGQFYQYLNYYNLANNKDLVLVTYYTATDLNDPNTYQEWGMTVDLNGNVKDKILFGPAFVSQKVIPDTKIITNINGDKGFLRYYPITNSSIGWQQYQTDSTNGTLSQLTYGTVDFNTHPANLRLTAFATIDEGYAIAFANNSNSSQDASNPLLPLGQLFLLPIGYNQSAISPLLLYQTQVSNIKFSSILCDIAYVGIGQTCVLSASQGPTTVQGGSTSAQNTTFYYIKVNFLSSGSVTSFQVINNILPLTTASPIWTVNSLRFGGFLLTNTGSSNISGVLYDENNNPHPWGFPEPEPINLIGIFGVLPNNNTLYVAQPDVSDSWQLQLIDLPKFSGSPDNGYSNLNVESTIPQINSNTSLDTKSISINFYNPVIFSGIGNISVYQVNGDKQYLRQSIPDSSCTIGNDGKTINADILVSTFSVSKGSYFISVDNGFVEDVSYREPLIGIGKNIWKLTANERTDQFATSTSGLLRLNVNGTQYFDSLQSNQHSVFFDTLLDELAIAIPLSRSRLSSNKRTQIDDPTASERQYLTSVGISETRDLSDISAATAIKILNALVQHKSQTQIGSAKLSSYLDETYGFKQSPDLWEKYKTRLLGVFLIIGLLIVLFLFAQRRDNNGNNIAILQLGLIIFGLVVQILFVSSNARDVPVLYIPSVLFITLPIGLNTILAFIIITKENTRPEFLSWFTTHGKVASVFTVLSGADIEALNVLHSNLAGFPFFRAPFSDDAKEKIFWCACSNIFIKDIPQVIIQVVYRYSTVSYDIVPLLTLISSALNLTVNIIGRLYHGTNRLRHRHGPGDDGNHSDVDDFGGLVPDSSNTSTNMKDTKDLEKLESGESGVSKSEPSKDSSK